MIDDSSDTDVATMLRNSAKHAAMCSLQLCERAGFQKAATVAGQLLEVLAADSPTPEKIQIEMAKFETEFGQPSTNETQRG